LDDNELKAVLTDLQYNDELRHTLRQSRNKVGEVAKLGTKVSELAASRKLNWLQWARALRLLNSVKSEVNEAIAGAQLPSGASATLVLKLNRAYADFLKVT